MKEKVPSKGERIREAKRRQNVASLIIVVMILSAIGLTVFYAVIPALSSSKPIVKGPMGRVEVGQKAPDFALPVVGAEGLTQDSFSSQQTRGNVVLLEFMVSWCSHCQNMALYIKDLNRDFQGRGLSIVSIAGTWQGASAESTAQFIRKYGSPWIHVLDRDNSVFNQYGVTSTPTYFVLDRDGNVRAKIEGEVPVEDLAAEIRGLLR